MVLDDGTLDVAPGDSQQRRLLEAMVGPTNSARSGQHPRDSVHEACDSATRKCNVSRVTRPSRGHYRRCRARPKVSGRTLRLGELYRNPPWNDLSQGSGFSMGDTGLEPVTSALSRRR